MDKKTENISVGFVALGCPKNMVDAEKMLALIGSSGFVITDDCKNADVVVINTCGFIESARQEAFDAIKTVIKAKKKSKVKKIIVAGCLVQKLGSNLIEQLKDVDAIVGLDDRDKIADVIKSVIVKTDRAEYIAKDSKAVFNDSQRLLLSPSHWAYLRISEGCSRKCSFCTIPFIRGKFRSKPLVQILQEANELAQSGVKELIIIAQDSSFYGRDIGLQNGLVKLLDELGKIDGLQWIRIMYLYPATITDELIDKVAASEKIVKYFDMPIQHINDDILKAMQRADTKAHTTEVINKIRAKIPNAILRTTVITGFPGENQQQFEELLEFIKQVKFDALGCFAYSREEGTASYDMPEQLSMKIKQARLEQIMLAQQQIVFEKNKQLINKTFQCIVEEKGDKGFGWGRYYGQAPEIDSICLIEKLDAQIGDIINVKVIGSDNYDLVVEQI